jgi:hypothetical protein
MPGRLKLGGYIPQRALALVDRIAVKPLGEGDGLGL